MNKYYTKSHPATFMLLALFIILSMTPSLAQNR